VSFRRFFILNLGHLAIDAYAAIFGPLVALARIDPVRIGAIGSLYAAATSFSQLAFGYLADRSSLRWFVAGGMAAAALFLSLAGTLTAHLWLLAGVLVLGGLGVAAFHPAAVVLAAEASGRHRLLGVSVFVTVGTLGFAASPVLFVVFATRWGLENSFLLAGPGLLVALLVIALLPREPAPRAAPRTLPLLAGMRAFLGDYGGALLPIYLLVVVRSMVFTAFHQFVPTLALEWGWSEALGGLANTVYIAAGAAGMFLCGVLAGRWNRRWIQAVSLLGGVPFGIAFLYADGLPPGAALALLAAAGLFINSTNTLHIVMGQEVAPRHASTISSLMMGFGWGMGAFGSALVGWLAKDLGLANALAVAGSLPLLSLPLIGRLRAPASLQGAAGLGARGA
jgi:FSR family fosmidomycin resistance protein-like MFS transporter